MIEEGNIIRPGDWEGVVYYPPDEPEKQWDMGKIKSEAMKQNKAAFMYSVYGKSLTLLDRVAVGKDIRFLFLFHTIVTIPNQMTISNTTGDGYLIYAINGWDGKSPTAHTLYDGAIRRFYSKGPILPELKILGIDYLGIIPDNPQKFLDMVRNGHPILTTDLGERLSIDVTREYRMPNMYGFC